MDSVQEHLKTWGKITCLEPCADSYKRLCDHVKSMPDIVTVQAGVGQSNRKKKIISTMGAGDTLSIWGDESVEVVTIDSLKETPTFIKMDVEGAEQDAIRGARETIRRCKPKLAISLYHKPNDIWEIPFLVKQLVPEYRLYIRHHATCQYETVMYAHI